MKVLEGRMFLHGDAIPWAGYEDKYYCAHCQMLQTSLHFRRCRERPVGSPSNKDFARRELTEWRRQGRPMRPYNAPNLYFMQGRRGD